MKFRKNKMGKRPRTFLVIATLVVVCGLFVLAFQFPNTPKKLKNIDKTPEWQIPVRDQLLTLLDPKDPNTIFTVVDASQKDQQLAVSCHEVAHDIGHRAYEYYGFQDAMTFDNPNHVKHALVQNICAGGYMHGVEEQMSLHEPGFLQHPEMICEKLSESEKASCFHGVGHVYMVAYARDVPQSLLGCRLIELHAERYRCFEGVRMEQFWGGTADVTSDRASLRLGWDREKPLATCISAKPDEKPTCFLYSAFGYLRVHPREYRAAAQLCSMEPDMSESDRHFCLKGLGMTMMSKFKGEGMEGSEQYVVDLTPHQKHSFYDGMVNYSLLSGKTRLDLQKTCGLLKNDSLICEDALGESK